MSALEGADAGRSTPVVLLLSGPNLALLGQRQPEIYGTSTLEDHVDRARTAATRAGCELRHLQSERESDLIEAVHAATSRADAIVVNAGALSHSSWALHDALAAFDGPVVELHLSNPDTREPWRRISVLAPVADGTIAGFGGLGYELAVEAASAPFIGAQQGRPAGLASAPMLNGREIATLPPMDVAERLPRLAARLGELGCEGLLVTKLTNIQYLTGFTGSAGLLVVLEDESLLVSDGRYRNQSAEQVKAAGVPVRIEIGRPAAQLESIEKVAKGLHAFGLEADDITWGAQQRLGRILGQFTKLVAVTKAVETLRMVKDDGELARIERAADIADVALAQVKEMLCDLPTEQEFAIALDFEMRRRGADAVAFETIVASGPNGALPHARPSEQRIQPGELIVIDFGAMVDGYRSDMTRTVCVGEAATEELRRILEAVLAAQRAGVRAVRPGVLGREVDAACRESLLSAGFGECFVHGTGHGVGLEIHEGPSVSQESTDILEEGAVVTVEPGAYLYPIGGARIEDTLVVTAGGARLLTKSTKDYVL